MFQFIRRLPIHTRRYRSRDDAIPAAAARLSLSLSQSLPGESEPSVRRTLEGTAPMRMKIDRPPAVGAIMRTAAEMRVVR